MGGTVLNLNQFQRATNIISVVDKMRSRVLNLDNVDGVDVDSDRRGQHVDNHVVLNGYDGLRGYATNIPGAENRMNITRKAEGSYPEVHYIVDHNSPGTSSYLLGIGGAEQWLTVNHKEGTITLEDPVGQVGGCLNATLSADDPRVATFESHLAALARG
jgi:hypothetical protein